MGWFIHKWLLGPCHPYYGQPWWRKLRYLAEHWFTPHWCHPLHLIWLHTHAKVTAYFRIRQYRRVFKAMSPMERAELVEMLNDLSGDRP